MVYFFEKERLVYFNYTNVNDKRETPAMRLGLAKGPVAAEKVIYFGRYD